MYLLAVDLGGTNIKTAVVNDEYEIISNVDMPTNSHRGAQAVCDDIAACAQDAVQKAGLSLESIAGIGIGCPGTVDPARGVVVYANNLDWHNFPLSDYLAAKINKPIFLTNDANAAALGEVVAGCARGAKDAVIVTLGTGVGSGVVLNGQLLTGTGGGAAEMGHMVIRDGGLACNCGRVGCWEMYASATALIAQTEAAIVANPTSGLALLASERGVVNGLTAFDAMRAGDAAGTGVVSQYIWYLSCGVINIVNTFQPEIVAFSGGISKEGEALLAPLREIVLKEMYGAGLSSWQPRFEICTLGHRAGIIGAAELARQGINTQAILGDN